MNYELNREPVDALKQPTQHLSLSTQNSPQAFSTQNSAKQRTHHSSLIIHNSPAVSSPEAVL